MNRNFSVIYYYKGKNLQISQSQQKIFLAQDFILLIENMYVAYRISQKQRLLTGDEKCMKKVIRNLLNQLPKLTENQRFILGIDGLSRSGKTTFSNMIKRLLKEKNIPVCLFHIDDFIVDKEKRYNT